MRVESHYENKKIPYNDSAAYEEVREYVKDAFTKHPVLKTCIDVEFILGLLMSKEALLWYTGWLDGVREFWGEVEDKL